VKRAQLARDFERLRRNHALETRRAERMARALEVAVGMRRFTHTRHFPLEAAARHEAAHLVAAMAQGAHPIGAVIMDLQHPDGGRYRDGLALFWTSKPFAKMACARAGCLADGSRDGRIGATDFQMFVNGFDEHERDAARPASAPRLWRLAGELAGDALRRHAEPLEVLTAHLLERRVLLRADIDAALGGGRLHAPRHTAQAATEFLQGFTHGLPQLGKFCERHGDEATAEAVRAVASVTPPATSAPSSPAPAPPSAAELAQGAEAYIQNAASLLTSARTRAREELAAVADNVAGDEAARAELEAIAAGDVAGWRVLVERRKAKTEDSEGRHAA